MSHNLCLKEEYSEHEMGQINKSVAFFSCVAAVADKRCPSALTGPVLEQVINTGGVGWKEFCRQSSEKPPFLSRARCISTRLFSSREQGQFSNPETPGYVGFANLPNQVHRKSVKKGFEFTLMVVGEYDGFVLVRQVLEMMMSLIWGIINRACFHARGVCLSGLTGQMLSESQCRQQL